MRNAHPQHGRRWSVWHPFGWSCRCGMGAYPCIVERTWTDPLGDPDRTYAAGLAEARSWQRDERRRWARGAR
jgi:hypothetical protein